jgi:hypothetical protein
MIPFKGVTATQDLPSKKLRLFKLNGEKSQEKNKKFLFLLTNFKKFLSKILTPQPIIFFTFLYWMFFADQFNPLLSHCEGYFVHFFTFHV